MLAPACTEQPNKRIPLHTQNIVNIEHGGTWRQKTTMGYRCGKGK